MNKEYYLNKAKYLEGKTISEALPNLKAEYSDNRRITKSVFANFVEKEYFNLDLNSYSRPDFEDVNLELKTSGIHFIDSKGIYNAKERLVLTQIDYFDVIEKEHWIDNKHPRRDFAERRAFCIKQRAFDHIIASSLNLEVRSVKGSIGLFKHDYPNFK